jgi:hypothetical protein
MSSDNHLFSWLLRLVTVILSRRLLYSTGLDATRVGPFRPASSRTIRRPVLRGRLASGNGDANKTWAGFIGAIGGTYFWSKPNGSTSVRGMLMAYA